MKWLQEVINFIAGIFGKVNSVVTNPTTEAMLQAAVTAGTIALESTPQGLAAKPAVVIATQEIISVIDGGTTLNTTDPITQAMNYIKVDPKYAPFLPIIQLIVSNEITTLMQKYFANLNITDLTTQLATLRLVCVWINNASGGTAK
jgi:hypothetical protein